MGASYWDVLRHEEWALAFSKISLIGLHSCQEIKLAILNKCSGFGIVRHYPSLCLCAMFLLFHCILSKYLFMQLLNSFVKSCHLHKNHVYPEGWWHTLLVSALRGRDRFEASLTYKTSSRTARTVA